MEDLTSSYQLLIKNQKVHRNKESQFEVKEVEVFEISVTVHLKASIQNWYDLQARYHCLLTPSSLSCLVLWSLHFFDWLSVQRVQRCANDTRWRCWSHSHFLHLNKDKQIGLCYISSFIWFGIHILYMDFLKWLLAYCYHLPLFVLGWVTVLVCQYLLIVLLMRI